MPSGYTGVTMTKKDYAKFALMLSQASYLSPEQRLQMANDMATVFALDNPRFNRGKFIEATEIPFVSGAKIGVMVLLRLISECDGGSASALSELKRGLGVKGGRKTVLAIAEHSFANVDQWRL